MVEQPLLIPPSPGDKGIGGAVGEGSRGRCTTVVLSRLRLAKVVVVERRRGWVTVSCAKFVSPSLLCCCRRRVVAVAEHSWGPGRGSQWVRVPCHRALVSLFLAFSSSANCFLALICGKQPVLDSHPRLSIIAVCRFCSRFVLLGRLASTLSHVSPQLCAKSRQTWFQPRRSILRRYCRSLIFPSS